MEPIITFTKKIKEASITHKDIPDIKDIEKISTITNKLCTLTGASKLRLTEINLRSNPKKWINSIIYSTSANNIISNMENLLTDFTDSMMTRMREESKYAVGIFGKEKLFLCHSVFGEETISPEWKIIPRMLDADNVLRFAAFDLVNSEVFITFWEKEATNSFMEWLGLPRKQAYLFGGNVRICSDIESLRIEFQLSEDEIDQLFVNHPEIQQGVFKFKEQLQYINIAEIRYARKNYQNPGDFLQDFQAEKFGVPYYQKEYSLLKRDYLPLLVKYFDEKGQVVRVNGDDQDIVVNKGNTPFDVIFTDGEIDIRKSYLQDLTRKYANSSDLKIFHAGLNFLSSPNCVCGMKIFNNIAIKVSTKQFLDYYNQIRVPDSVLDPLLKYAGLILVARDNQDSPIRFLLEEISEELKNGVQLSGKILETENDLVEFKSSDYFSGKNEDISNRIVSDYQKKSKTNKCKLYIIGVEDDGMVNPIPSSRVNSDRLTQISKLIEGNLNQFVKSFATISDRTALIFIFICN